MTAELRARKIESYGNAHGALVDALNRFPQGMWRFKDDHGSWSIHEIVIHIADSEANSYIRCRRIIAEPDVPLSPYDENQWADSLRYHEQSTEDALELFRWLRRKSYLLVKSLPEAFWSNTAYHPENGNMTLDDWLDVYERHVPEHIQQISENYEAWLKS